MGVGRGWGSWYGVVAGALLLVGGSAAARAQGVGGAVDTASADRVRFAVDSLVAAERARRPVAGMVVAVVRGADTLVMKGYGHADLEHRVPMTPDGVFRIASITKQFTASAVLRLVEDGRLSLDDPPSRYVPTFPDTSGAIRVRHLLNHTSGLPDIYELEGWEKLRPRRPGHAEARKQMTRLLSGAGLHFRPGTAYSYSNAGYDFLGDVVEAASGEPWGRYLEREVFERAGLEATRFCTTREVIPHRVQGYDPNEAGHLVNAFRHSPHYLFASGGLCSTARDLVRWNRALHDGAVVSPESVGRMTTPEGGTSSYGYGIGVSDLAGHRKLGHNGSLPGFSSQLDYYPDDDLVVVVLANSPAAVGTLADAVARVVLGLPPRPPAAPPEGWRVVTGRGRAARDSIDFRVMGAGVHTTTGPGALYFSPDSVAHAPYEAFATFIQIGDGSEEGLGLMLAGTDTASGAPRHLLVRIRGDGSWSAELRRGTETVRLLRPWARDEAVAPVNRRGARNELRVRMGVEEVVVLANGAVLGTIPAGRVGDLDGVVGLFVGRDHDVHIAGFGLEPGHPANPSPRHHLTWTDEDRRSSGW